MPAPGGVPLPQLGISSGPAVSDAVSGGSTVNFGPFSLRDQQPQSIIERALPFAVIGGLIWLLIR